MGKGFAVCNLNIEIGLWRPLRVVSGYRAQVVKF